MEEDNKQNEITNQISTNETKEFVVNRPLTMDDVRRFNEQAPVTIVLSNLKNQSASIISELSKNNVIRVLGPFDEFKDKRFATERYRNLTSYTPDIIARIIRILDGIAEGIYDEWTDLEKATYGYVALMRNVKPLDDETGSEEPLREVADGRTSSLGYALIYKELLDRLGIAARVKLSPKLHAWNEILVEGDYYPCDLYLDSRKNEQTIDNGAFEVSNYLSDREFYYMPEHQENEEIKSDEEVPVHAMDHSLIQDAIDNIFHGERKEKEPAPIVEIKSEQLRRALKTDVVSEESPVKNVSSIKIDLDGGNVEDLKEDIIAIGKAYPQVLSNITLSNSSGTHVDMQEIVDAIYEGRSDDSREIDFQTEIVIESDIAEDFDIDFSRAPDVNSRNEGRVDGHSFGQKITFRNTGSSPISMPSTTGKIPDSIDCIRVENFDVRGFDIRSNRVVDAGKRRLELVGGSTHHISDIVGLDQVYALQVTRLSQADFDEVMDLANNRLPQQMPSLIKLEIDDQFLAGRPIFTEITNPNIIELEISSSALDNIVGFDAVKNQFIRLYVNNNELSIDDLRQISNFGKEKEPVIISIHGENKLYSEINGLTGDIISDETYQYLESYFKKSGNIVFRGMQYDSMVGTEARKKQMLKDISSLTLNKVPYFIEDARVFREVLPYTQNPMMVKDLATFRNYLNDPSHYFEQPFLRDGVLWLTKEQLEELITSGKTIPQEVHIKINNVSELTRAELQVYKNACDSLGINLKGVNVFDDRYIDPTRPDEHNFDGVDTSLATYKISEYDQIRETLDMIIDGITPGMPDVEKFAVIYKRLADLIAIYDHGVCGEGTTIDEATYKVARYDTSRNLSEGLIAQPGLNDPTNAYRAVCAGYADILKNALALVDIEAVLDGGNAERYITTGRISGGHEWTKVQIDGKWYYCDLCWDAPSWVHPGSSYSTVDRWVNNGWALKGSDSFVYTGKRHGSGSNEYEVVHIADARPGDRHEQMEHDDFDRATLKDLFLRVENKEIPPQGIIIPEDPTIPFDSTIDIDAIKHTYQERKDDMYAKYYGDRDYQQRYDEIAARYREHEIEVTRGGITYRTVEDYPEKSDDERFLILDGYKDALERMTRYEAGDTSVYSGTPDQIQIQLDKDREYVETRNFTFDQHKNTQKDLATLGKFGERMPYIPMQTGLFRNGLIALGNVGIFARNLVAPVYRFVGRTVAQPIHRLVTGGRDASPYRNNPYHRFVARRDYFRDMAQEADRANGTNHPIINYLTSNINAIIRAEEGNEAVLKAGAYDIQENLKAQQSQVMLRDYFERMRDEYNRQIADLQAQISSNPYATNIAEAQRKLAEKRRKRDDFERRITSLATTGRINDIQTDAISQTQHDIASKEVNTYRVAAIKGVARIGVKRFVGPKIRDWLAKRAHTTIERQEVYTETIYREQTIKDPDQIIPIMEKRPDYGIEVDDLISNNGGKTVKLYRSVSGGNRGEVAYTMTGNEACTGFHFQNGTTWGTGYSGNVPLMTDNYWPSSFLDINNHLRDDLTFAEIAQAIQSGELSEELLSTMTLQVGGRGWVYANELFEGITREVQVGTDVIEGATRVIQIPEEIERFRTVYDVVENTRIVNALNTLNGVSRVADVASPAHTAFEVGRPTNSNEVSNKTRVRHYDYDDSEYDL